MKASCILIIEDELYIRDSLAEFFKDEGYLVEVAASGEEGLGILKRCHVDVAIVDIRLSGIDGERTIQHIKQLYPKVYILVFTGSLEFQISSDLAQLGLSEGDVIYKPINDLSVISQKVAALGFKPAS